MLFSLFLLLLFGIFGLLNLINSDVGSLSEVGCFGLLGGATHRSTRRTLLIVHHIWRLCLPLLLDHVLIASRDFVELVEIDALVGVVVETSHDSFNVTLAREKAITVEEVAESHLIYRLLAA